MTLSKREVTHIFQQLRSGVVPEVGLDAFAVGIERQRAEVGRMLDLAESGEGVFKFLRGGYGCGKTFMARLAVLDAQARDFADELRGRLRQRPALPSLRRRLPQGRRGARDPRLPPAARSATSSTAGSPRSKNASSPAAQTPNGPDFDAKVQQRMEEDIAARTGGKAPRTSPARSARLRAEAEGAAPRRRRAGLVALGQRPTCSASVKRSPRSRATSQPRRDGLPSGRARGGEGRGLQGPRHRHRRGRDHPAHAAATCGESRSTASGRSSTTPTASRACSGSSRGRPTSSTRRAA
jgi:hypothetical protein